MRSAACARSNAFGTPGASANFFDVMRDGHGNVSSKQAKVDKTGNKKGTAVMQYPSKFGGVDGTRTRDPRRDRPVF